ncbi:MAG: nucleoside deaminase [Candidatus Binatia bacterium]
MIETSLQVTFPPWVESLVTGESLYKTDEEKMALAIELARRNVQEQTGEPFGAAVFRADSGQLVGVGMSQVVRQKNSVLHAEVVALMMAEQRLQTYNLRADGHPYELFSSCDPCAMCLGAIHWSAVARLACGATRDDAQSIGFDEGPVFPASYAYLEAQGMTITREVLRAEASAVIRMYAHSGGLIHNRIKSGEG